jgi:hypothetical protein
VPFRREQTGGSAKASRQLDEALESGRSAMVDISVADMPYWHLPAEEAGCWGYPVAVTGPDDDGYVVDDRAEGRLTVTSEAMAIARGRIPSYKNRVLTIGQSRHLDIETVLAAVEPALEDAVQHLGSGSESFSLPAFRKWGRMVVSDAAKGWRRVYADRIGLWSALRTTHEAVSDNGMEGGSLRPLYAEFLEEVGPLLGRPGLAEVAERYRGAAEAWDDVADATLPEGFEPLRDAVELARRRRESMRRGDAGDAEAAAAASQLNSLGDEFDSELPLTESELEDLFQGLSAAIEAAYRVEVEAHAAMSEVIHR